MSFRRRPFHPVSRNSFQNKTKGIFKLKLYSKLSTFILFTVLAGIVLMIAAIIFFATQIPSADNLTSRNVASATKIYDRNGELLYDIFENQYL
jgi:membrane carboxypeptidase/penicillin-binding protein